MQAFFKLMQYHNAQKVPYVYLFFHFRISSIKLGCITSSIAINENKHFRHKG